LTLTLVIGGTRSGKSAHGEALAAATGLPVRFVATADPGDRSMRTRIDGHRARRPAAWRTVEVALGEDPSRTRIRQPIVLGRETELADACSDARGECVLLDGLGPWIAGQLHRRGAFDDTARLPAASAEILAGVARTVRALALAGAAIVVAEQAGSGVLPAEEGSRAWVDLLGEATRQIAAHAERVDLVVAGRAITLGAGSPPALQQSAGSPPAPQQSAGSPPAPRQSGPDNEADASLRRHGDRDVRPGDADHAVNVISGGPPAWLQSALDAALATDAERYPRDDAAIAAIAGLHDRDPEEIVPTNGAAEALWLLGPALRPTLAACVHPGFTEAEAGLRAHRVPTVRVLRDPEADFALDPAAIPDAADLVVVGNPASPSGTLVPSTAILALRRPGRTVVVDEAFMDLVPGQPGSVVRERADDLIVVRSLTKALSVPGLRVGYAVAAAGLADRLRAVRPPWSANVLALAALAAAAGHPEQLAEIAERAAAERDDLYRRLARIPGVRTWPAAANFVLIAVDDGPGVLAALRGLQIAVRPAGSFPGLDARHIRITARDPDSNARIAAALSSAVGPGPSRRGGVAGRVGAGMGPRHETGDGGPAKLGLS
jgi:histidinol-phosphate/aromatic aminotransferase/cobyric acid decarboxylase-like protein/adenosyl cobinamide kinase/adenosyl cobinamide phosphate guanylyltransferase